MSAEKMRAEHAFYEPAYSPWGKIQNYKFLTKGAFFVSTASHGGIMVLSEVAEHLLSEEARKIGFVEGRYLCFEEDCDAPVAIRELLDLGLMKAPVNEYYKEGEYSDIINDSLKRWHSEYWQTREQRENKKKSRDREDR